MLLFALAAGWFLLTRPAYRIEGDFLYHEDQRNTADGWLAEQMQSPVAEHRARACLALGRIADPATLNLLLSALRDPIPGVRAAAGFAVGLMQSREFLAERGRDAEPLAGEALIAALEDEDRLVVTRVVEALGKMGWQAAFPRITQTAAPLPATMTALVRLGNPEAVPWIIPYLRSDDQDARRAAADALQGLEANVDADITRSFLRLTKDRNLWVRVTAVKGLGGAQSSPEVLEALSSMTADPDAKVRIEAFRSFGRLAAAESLTALTEGLEDPHENVNVAAVEAMGMAGNREAVPLLRRLRFVADPIAYQAELSLAQLGEAEDFFAGIEDVPPSYRTPAGLESFVSALGRLSSPESLAWLQRLWRREEGYVVAARPAILRVLATRDVAGLPSYLNEALGSEDFTLRRVALDLMSDPSFAVCRRVYDEAGQNTDSLLQLAALDAAARARDDAARKGLFLEALEHPDRLVRLRAVRHLRLLYGEDHDAKIGLGEIPRAREDYQPIARTLGQRVVMETTAGVLEIALDYDSAALTAEYFLELVRRNAYDDIRFGEVESGRWAKTENPPPASGSLPFVRSEINPQPFLRGSLGMMAETSDAGRGRFFICLSPQPLLDGRYTNFGRLVSGDNVIDNITVETRILRVGIP